MTRDTDRVERELQAIANGRRVGDYPGDLEVGYDGPSGLVLVAPGTTVRDGEEWIKAGNPMEWTL